MLMSCFYRFFFRAGLIILLGLAVSCKEADVRLVNKVKTFDPKWSTLNEQFTWLDRNLSLLEKRFEQDFKEVEGMLTAIPDSLRGRKYRTMLKDYEGIIQSRDTSRLIYTDVKSSYVKAVNKFNDWEIKVSAGDIETEQGYKDLEVYQQQYTGMETITDSLKGVLTTLAASHNKILRELSELMEIYTNYDIQLR